MSYTISNSWRSWAKEQIDIKLKCYKKIEKNMLNKV